MLTQPSETILRKTFETEATLAILLRFFLTLSWRRSLSYRNQSIALRMKELRIWSWITQSPLSFKWCFRYFSYQKTLTLRPHILFILEIFYIIRNIFQSSQIFIYFISGCVYEISFYSATWKIILFCSDKWSHFIDE